MHDQRGVSGPQWYCSGCAQIDERFEREWVERASARRVGDERVVCSQRSSRFEREMQRSQDAARGEVSVHVVLCVKSRVNLWMELYIQGRAQATRGLIATRSLSSQSP